MMLSKITEELSMNFRKILERVDVGYRWGQQSLFKHFAKNSLIITVLGKYSGHFFGMNKRLEKYLKESCLLVSPSNTFFKLLLLKRY